ncbi:MAG: phosphatase PAP2 family protein [Cyanobacteria bacterium]|nr:phosphatase PAP2 family protein [Cyanobacteriota bacterium]
MSDITPMRRFKPMAKCLARSICVVAILSLAPAALQAQDLPAPVLSAEAHRAKVDDRSFVQTIKDDLKSVVSVATYAIGRAFDRPKVAAIGGDLIEAQGVAGASTFALKHTIRRTRPDGEPRSFPSGHASGTFAAATVIQRHYGLKGAIPAYSAAVLITGARMQANSHYPTDLIMGAATGILSGRAATFELGQKRIHLSPAATPGGVAVMGTIQ